MTKRPPALRRPTLRDIAKKVGVHPSTVSRVLNSQKSGKISQEVTLKVRKAAENAGFHLNPFARGLKTNRSFTVGVLIPDLTDPLFPPIVRGIENTLGPAGYTAILANCDNDPAHERRSFETMRARKVDGFLLVTAHRSDELVDRCVGESIPLVLINRHVDSPEVPSVANDDEGGVRLAVDHLVGIGHRHIGHVVGPQNLSTGYGRLMGFLSAMRANGLEAGNDVIAIAEDFTEGSGRKAALALLRRRPDVTAIVAAGDMLALGCYDALSELGLHCPEDISVTGFNDIAFAGKFAPPLTTVHAQKAEMGTEAARLILRIIQGETIRGVSLVLRPTLVVRGSTAPPSAIAGVREIRSADTRR